MKKFRIIICVIAIIIAILGLLDITPNYITMPIVFTTVGICCMTDAFNYYKMSMKKMALISLVASIVCITLVIFSLYVS